ncbi:MAG: pseudouridine synthase [Phycisphaerales bacterium]|nr:pseudouridine synthase [Phycisphaerales bacterium]
MNQRRGKLVAPLASRAGVGPSRTCLPAGSWTTIAECLIERFPEADQAEWMRRIAEREVVDRDGIVVSASRRHEPGLVVFYYRTLGNEVRIPFDEVVLFQDEHIVVADKPHFLPVIPAGRYLQETLLVRLKRKLGIDTLVPIHRIDRATAGLVVFSAQESTRDRYQALFRERLVEKQYEAIASRNIALQLPMVYESRVVQDDHFMRMREVAGHPNASTHIALIETLVSATGAGECARYRLAPTSGRKHQLRVQCAALGIPILNDPIYPVLLPSPPQGEQDDYSKPLQLLARVVAFADPVTGQARRFESRRRLDWPTTAL